MRAGKKISCMVMLSQNRAVALCSGADVSLFALESDDKSVFKASAKPKAQIRCAHVLMAEEEETNEDGEVEAEQVLALGFEDGSANVWHLTMVGGDFKSQHLLFNCEPPHSAAVTAIRSLVPHPELGEDPVVAFATSSLDQVVTWVGNSDGGSR